MTIVKVDQKGRLLIPQRDREALGIRPGDAFVVEREGQVLRYAKAPNPFDTLAAEALAEHRAGRTRNVRDLLAESASAHDGQ